MGCLPDVAPMEEHHPHHHNCPVNEILPPLPPPSRCNGRAVPVRELLLPSSAQASRVPSFGTIASLGPLNVRESFSSTSSKSDSKTWCEYPLATLITSNSAPLHALQRAKLFERLKSSAQLFIFFLLLPCVKF